MILPGALGYLAAGLVLLTFGMRSMVPMRMVATLSNLAFIAYGLSLGLTPVWVLHGLLLPLNIYRLRECRRRPRHPKRSAPAEPSRPVIARRRFARGDILFHKGDFAHDTYYLLKGRVRLREIDGRIGSDDPLAELSLPGRTGRAPRPPSARPTASCWSSAPLSRRAPRAASPKAGRAQPDPRRELVPSCQLGAQAKRLTTSPLPGSVPGIANAAGDRPPGRSARASR